MLLDLSAAFDTGNHNTLLGCLKSWFGHGGTEADLNQKVAVLAAYALVSGCLDYCNCLFSSLSCFSQHQLQSIQNTFACIITHLSKYAHVTSILN